jgi:hypothetical protein
MAHDWQPWFAILAWLLTDLPGLVRIELALTKPKRSAVLSVGAASASIHRP